ncbi:MAG: pyridoxal 5'-phosphate synthase glutaminase subunit PdxT [Proteobacteria bacterium]|nr:pyridoxal 5'-phosphate synthase glutaminase subunit PdxT [Pseudomonadota bacterium]
MLRSIGAQAIAVRTPEELASVDRLVMPGGESTTMLKLLLSSELWEPLREFANQRPVWGICAGSILLAREVQHPAQESLGVINIRAHRNFYGSQLDSFKSALTVTGIAHPVEVDFIRAPRLEPLAESVKVLAKTADGTPVLMQEGHILVSAFHTELGSDPALHRYFVYLPA